MRAVLLGTFAAASEATAQDAWLEPGVAVGGGPPPLPRALLSHTLGDGMVLQRAPQSAMIFGYAPAGTTVTTTFDGRALEPLSTADASQTWRQALPPTAGGGPPHDIAVSASTGHNATLRGVLFGDVFVCGGQSNMAFSLPANERFAHEQLEAASRPGIRLFTVGTSVGTLQNGAAGPQPDLRWVNQRWTPASAASIGGCNSSLDGRCMTRTDKGRLLNCSGAANQLSTCSEFGYFSALCWHFGKRIYDANEGKVPVGLISSNWGGTPLEDWATADAFKACGGFKPEPRDTCRTAAPGRGGNGVLWNSMLAPFAHGPTQLSGFLWWQGEANTKGLHCARSYRCMFPAMVNGWRSAFKQAEAYFGFVGLSTWCPVGEHGLGLPQMREAQMAAAELPGVGWATAADWGAGCDIHPPMKQPVAYRLADSAIALLGQYAPLRAKLNLTTPGSWRSPTFNSTSSSRALADGRVAVRVALNDATDLRLITPRNYRGMALNGSTTTAGYSTGPPTNCSALNHASPNTCAWAAIEISSRQWLNASVRLDATGRLLVLTTVAPVLGTSQRMQRMTTANLTGTAYGYGPIPLLSVETVVGGLPVLPWNTSSEMNAYM